MDVTEGLELFDLSLKLKEEGMAAAAENKPIPLEIARQVAKRIASKRGCVEMDQVMAELQFMDIAPGPWCGSVFSGKDWIFTGSRIRSARPGNHARELKVWALK